MIFKQDPHVRVGQQKAYFIERDGLFFGLNIVQKRRICRHCLLLSGMQHVQICKSTANQLQIKQ